MSHYQRYASRILTVVLFVTICLVLVPQPTLAEEANNSLVRANDADFIVQDTLDLHDVNPGDGLCTTIYGTCSLRAAIAESNALAGQQRVYILPGEYAQGDPGDFDITDDLVLIGYGVNQTRIVQRSPRPSNYDRLFDIDPLQTGKTVIIANLTLYSPSFVSEEGVAVRNYGNLTLENVRLVDTMGNSGIYNVGTLTINRGYFADNTLRNTIFNTATGTMTIRNSLISRNIASSSNGGSVRNNGTLLIENSTISYNRANTAGAGLLNSGTGSTMTLNFVTLVANHGGYNSTTAHVGGVYNTTNAILNIGNSIITGNLGRATPIPANCNTVSGAQTISQGYNVFGDGGCPVTGDTSSNIVLANTSSVLLSIPADYAFQTDEVALLEGSPAIDVANPAACLAIDQRGAARPVGDCDAGAYERITDNSLYPPIIPTLTINETELIPRKLFTAGVTQIALMLSEDVFDPIGDSDPDDVTNPANYRLFSSGANQRFETLVCSTPQGDDTAITINTIAYDTLSYSATVHLNDGLPLANGTYAFFVCGTTSITDVDGNALDGDMNGVDGDDYLTLFQLASVGETAQTGSVLQVNTTADDAYDGMCSTTHCTLRDAVITANNQAGAATILVPAGTYTLTRTYPALDDSYWGDLDVLDAVTIQGAGALQTVIDANSLSRVFHIDAFADVVMRGITVRGGRAAPDVAPDEYNGGAIFVASGNLALYDALIRDNYSQYDGGGIFFGTQGKLVTIQRSAIINNESGLGNGGGLAIYGILPGTHLLNTTIAENHAAIWGGGIYFNVSNTPLNVEFVTLVDNIADSASALMCDATQTILNFHNNIVARNGSGGGSEDYGACDIDTTTNIVTNDVAGLLPLANNGGSTLTQALTPTSTAIGSAVGTCPPTDQRGVLRRDGGCDRGAYEANFAPLIIGTTLAPSATAVTVTFSEAMNPIAITSSANYRLVNDGVDNIFATQTCTTPQGDDQPLLINTVVYDGTTRTATLSVNNGATLPYDHYRVIVCSTVTGLDGQALDGNRDGMSGDDGYANFYYDTAQTSTEYAVTVFTDEYDGVCGSLHCTLREALLAANNDNAASIVNLPAGTYHLTRLNDGMTPELTTGDLDITTGALQLIGAGANQTMIDAQQIDRVLEISSTQPVSIAGITLQNGLGRYAGGIVIQSNTNVQIRNAVIRNNTGQDSSPAGGIYVGSATVVIENTTISGNRAIDTEGSGAGTGIGGGIKSYGNLTLNNVTISGNEADIWGGGIAVFSNTTRLNNVTIVANVSNTALSSNLSSGGLHRQGGTVFIHNTLIANNSNALGLGFDCSGTITSQGGNLIANPTNCSLTGITANDITGVSPLLAGLADNGGTTQTHALTVGSPAINAGFGTCLLVDQRGVVRTNGCDIGAYEYSTSTPATALPLILSVAETVTNGQLASATVTFSKAMSSAATNPVSYRLVSAGANNTFQTTTCGSIQGDDQLITVAGVAYNGGLYQSIVAFTSVSGINFRFFVCASLLDANGNALDGDANGTAGGDYHIDWLIDPLQPGPDFYVNTLDDVNDSQCTNAHCTLWEAIEAAAEGATVHVPAGTYQLTIGAIPITTAINIIGAGAEATILQAAPSSAVFDITTGNTPTTLQGMTFTGGYDGAVYANTRALVIRDVLFDNNSGANGGALVVYIAYPSGTLTIENTVFSNNSAVNGGALWLDGYTSSASIDDSAFVNNTAAEGGAIWVDAPLKITNSTISGNTASVRGGAIQFAEGGADLEIIHTTITNNAAPNTGGIFAQFPHPDIYLARSILYGNSGGDCSAYSTQTAFHTLGYNVLGAMGNCTFYGTLNPMEVDGSDIIGQDPLLAPLTANYGTYFHDLQVGSLAWDVIPYNYCMAEDDQLGVLRPVNVLCDIGAIEAGGTLGSSILQVALVTGADGSQSAIADGNFVFAPNSFAITFTHSVNNPSGHTDSADVTNMNNYQLVAAGNNNTIDTTTCGTVQGDDALISFSGLSYDTNFRRTTLNLSTALGEATYRLLVCDNLTNLLGSKLDGNADGVPGGDFATTFDVIVPPVVSSVHITNSMATLTFSEPVLNPAGDTDPHDVTNISNYRIFVPGNNGIYESDCTNLNGDDAALVLSGSVTYDDATKTAIVNYGQTLAVASYRLVVCGSTSIKDEKGYSLDGDFDGLPGGDFVFDFAIYDTAGGNVLIVNSTNDSDDGVCNTSHCSLREALNASNSLAGMQQIHFNIAGIAPYTINLNTYLPGIEAEVILDATTQPGYAGSPVVVLSGNGTSGLSFHPGGEGSTIRGFVLNGFNDAISATWGDGATIENNYIGTDYTGTQVVGNTYGIFLSTSNVTIRNNVISGNDTGIYINSSHTGNQIIGNRIGTDKSGTQAVPNTNGIYTQGSNVQIGGTTPAARNIISGNTQNGIFFPHVNLLSYTGTVIEGNYIGVDITGTQALPNGNVGLFLGRTAITPVVRGNVISGNGSHGVALYTHNTPDWDQLENNYIGTDATGTQPLGNGGHGVYREGGGVVLLDNVIAANNGYGVYITARTRRLIIEGNAIGTNTNGTIAMSNGSGGIYIANSPGTFNFAGDSVRIGGIVAADENIIAYNNGKGITITGMQERYNGIFHNRIYDNAGLGIDLGNDGVTPNDNLDADSGANGLLNTPTLSNVTQSGANMVITGTMHTSANTLIKIDFYGSAQCDSSLRGEGSSYIGSTSVTTSGSGNANFNLAIASNIAIGSYVTAIATDPLENSSEFSKCVEYVVDTGLAAPLNLTATLAEQTVTLSWADITVDETGFRIERSTNNGATWSIITTTSANVTTYGDTFADCTVDYLYRVQAVRSSNSVVSAYATLTVAIEPLCPPQGLSVDYHSPDVIGLIWADVPADATLLEIEIRQSATEHSTMPHSIGTWTLDVVDRSTSIEVACEQYYIFRLRAYRNVDNVYSLYSDMVDVTAGYCTPQLSYGSQLSVTQINLAIASETVGLADSLNIERSADSGLTWTQIATVPSSTLEYIDSGVTCGNSYQYRLRAAYGAAFSAYSEVLIVELRCAIPAPTNLRLLQATTSTSSLRLDFDAPVYPNVGNHTLQYRIERSTDSGTTWSQIASVSTNSYTIGNVCTTQLYRVRAYRSVDATFSPYSATIFNAGCPPNLTTAAVVGQGINLTWVNNTAGASGFTIERRSAVNPNWQEIAVVGSGTTQYLDSNLDCTVSYSYRMRAIVGGQYTAYSFQQERKPLCNLVAPQNLTTQAILSDVVLSWTNSNTDINTTLIERSADNGATWAQIGSVNSSVVAYTDTTVMCEITYQYRVRSYRSADDTYSPYSVAVTIADSGVCNGANFRVLSADTIQIVLAWDDVSSNESGYRLERFSAAADWELVTLLPPNATQYADTDKLCDTQYEYRLRAYRDSDNSVSAWSTQYVLIWCTLNAPAGLTVTASGDDRVSLQWQDTSSTESMVSVEYSADGGTNWVEVVQLNWNSTTYVATGLTCETLQTYRVRAYRSSDDTYSPYSNVAFDTTWLCAPTVTATASLTPLAILIAWQDNSSNETEYRIESSPNGSNGWIEIATVGANSTSYEDENLPCLTPIYYRVRAFRAADSSYSNYSAVVNASANCVLVAPSSLNVTSNIYSQVTLQWHDPNLDEVNYVIERSQNSGATWTQIASVAANTTTYANSGLTCGATYSYRVRAYRTDDNAYSGYSPTAHATITTNCLQLGTVFTVNALTDSNDGYCEINHCTLREAFAAAQPVLNSTIAIPAGTITFTTNTTLTLANATVTLEGVDSSSSIIDFANIGQGITLSNSQVTVRNLQLVNSADRGIGIGTGTLRIEDSIVRSADRGGVLAGQANLTIIRSVVADNISPIDGAGVRAIQTHLTIQNSTINNNSHYHTGQAQSGAGIYQQGAVNLLIENSTISNNGFVYHNTYGGGIAIYQANNAAVSTRIVNTTISNNRSTNGSGIWMYAENTNLELEHVTITNNEDGIELFSGQFITLPAQLRATVIVGNSEQNVVGSITDLGYNVIGGDALLGTLQDNGGATWTHALLADSPALNIIPAEECTLATDQRGYTRPGGIGCDAGAYEMSETLSPLATPTALTVTATDADTITLNWVDNAINESAYYVERSTDGGATWTQLATRPANSTTFVDTVPACLAATYHYRVQAYRFADDVYSAYSNIEFIASFTCPAPSTPGNLTLSGVGDNHITANWFNHEPYATAIYLERSLDNGNSWTAFASLAANVTSYQDNDVTCGQAYTYRIRAYRANDDSYSAYSSNISLTLVCPAPTNLQANPFADTAIDLNWSDNLTQETAYSVERSADAGVSWTEIVSLAANSTTYTDSTVTCNTSYSYRVRGYLAPTSTYSAYSSVVAATLPCPSPTNLATTTVTAASVSLVWLDNMATETNYQIERSTDNGTIWQQIASIAANSTTYSDSTVECERAFAYRVRGYRSSDGFTSDYSNIVNISTPTCPVPRPPANFAASGTTRNSITINWNDNNLSVVMYHIERTAVGTNNWVQIAEIAAGVETFANNNLLCNRSYDYRMRAFRPADSLFSSYSSMTNAMTLACPPLDPPPPPPIDPPGRSEVTVNLPAMSDVTTYYIERQTINPPASNPTWVQVAAVPATTTEYADNGLNCGRTYAYRLRAYRAEDNSYSPYSSETTIITAPCPIPVTNTVGLYRNGLWQFRDVNATDAATVQFYFGPREAGWIALTGDWDGDGVDGIGLYKNGLFILRNISEQGSIELSFRFGAQESGWQPIVGDWNGDGMDTIGVYRNGLFNLRDSNADGTADYRFNLGAQESGWQAVAGDWDASGWDSVGLYRNGYFYLTNSLDGGGLRRPFQFGPVQSGWKAVAGDWNADGVMSVGLYNGSIWRLRNINDTGASDLGFNFGTVEAGWQPLASYRGGSVALAMLAQSAMDTPLVIPTEPVITATPEATEAVITPIATATLEVTSEVTEGVIENTPTAVPTETVIPLEPTVEITTAPLEPEPVTIEPVATETPIISPEQTAEVTPETTGE